MKKEIANTKNNTIKGENTMNTTITMEALNKLTKAELIKLAMEAFLLVLPNKMLKPAMIQAILEEQANTKEIAEELAEDELTNKKKNVTVKEIVCCGTGRRPKDLFGYKKENYTAMVERMKAGVKWLVDTKGVTKFITGGAQGWDQLLFWAVNAVKREPQYASIKNVLYLPMRDQDCKWASTGLFGRAEYNLMLKYADDINYVTYKDSQASYKEIVDAMMARNHAMVNDSTYVFACYPDDSWKKVDTKGGTAECLRYAYDHKRDTIIMDTATLNSRIYNFSQLQ